MSDEQPAVATDGIKLLSCWECLSSTS